MDFVLILICVVFLALLVGVIIYFESTRPWEPQHLFLDDPKKVQISDHLINYYQKGEGEDLVFIHGHGSNARCWEDLYDPFSKKYRVTALDLPGFGLSEKHPELHYGYKEQIRRLCEFLDKLNIKKAKLIGCSMGGCLAIGMAIDHPEIVDSLVVIAPAINPILSKVAPKKALGLVTRYGHYIPHPIIIKFMASQVFRNPKKLQPHYIEHYYSSYHNSRPAIITFWKTLDTIREFPYYKKLGLIQQPILLLYGKKDRTTPWWTMKSMLKQISQLEYYQHPKGGHHLMEDEPDFVIEKMQKFFGTT